MYIVLLIVKFYASLKFNQKIPRTIPESMNSYYFHRYTHIHPPFNFLHGETELNFSSSSYMENKILSSRHLPCLFYHKIININVHLSRSIVLFSALIYHISRTLMKMTSMMTNLVERRRDAPANQKSPRLLGNRRILKNQKRGQKG